MTEPSSTASSPPTDYDQRIRQFGIHLLAADSPVANESAFKRDREQYQALTLQRDQLYKTIHILKDETKKVRKEEKALTDAEVALQNARKQLSELAMKLGEASFAALQANEIENHPRFAARKKHQALIDSLKDRKAALMLSNNSGVLEQASLKAQELAIAGQIKLEELKINSLNRELGEKILAESAEPSLHAHSLIPLLQTIESRRAKITEAESTFKHQQAIYNQSKQHAAEKTEIQAIANAAALEAQVQQQNLELKSIENRIEDMYEDVAEKALSYDWLNDNPGLQGQLAQLKHLRSSSTPKPLSIWPLATVVIIGHLFSSFGSRPLNLNATGILLLYITSGLAGLALLSFYKPELAEGQRRYKTILLLFGYSILSIIAVSGLQDIAEYALENKWYELPSWARNKVGIVVYPLRLLLAIIGRSYRETFAIFGGKPPESFLTFFRDHLLSVGLCEELIKLAPALVALMTYRGDWRSRSDAFNSQLVYLAMIGGLAFGLGEAVHYHFTMYLPGKVGWGIYVMRFMTLVTIHAVWAGISGWILAHLTGGWIRSCFTVFAHGLGPVTGGLLVALTLACSDVLHTSHNLSNNMLWMLAWDIVSLALFAWLVRCSTVTQVIPKQWKNFSKKGMRGLEASLTNKVVDKTIPKASNFAQLPKTQETTIVEASAIDADSPNTTTTLDKPELWNPNAAGLWSLIFSPIFGTWLHARNWKTLQEEEKYRKSMMWFYGSIAASIVSLLLPSKPSTALGLLLLVVWWLMAGQEQYKYVKEKYPNYHKKRWGTPLSIAVLVLFILSLIFLAVSVDLGLTQV
jgi:hypothetical protein